MDRLRVGIVGINRAQYFAEALKSCEHTEITAVCDIDTERLDLEIHKFGAPKAFHNYSEMLDSGIDLALIASPLPFHVPMSIEALSRDMHVFCEVPAACSVEEGKQLVDAVRRSKAKYMTAENCCYMKPIMIVKNMARAGLFGELYYAEGSYVHFIRFVNPPGGWRDEYLFGKRGGTYLTHALGPILDWLDDRVATVNCVGTGSHVYRELSGDDSSTLMCKTEKGAMIVLRNDMLSPRPFKGYASLQGTKGCFEPDWFADGDDHLRVCFMDPHSAKNSNAGDIHGEWKLLSEFEEEFTPDLWRTRPAMLAEEIHGGADALTILDFIDAIVNDKPSPIDVYRGLDMTLPGLISEASAKLGGMPIQVPDPRLF